MLKNPQPIALVDQTEAERLLELFENERIVFQALGMPLPRDGVDQMDDRRVAEVLELARDISRLRMAAIQNDLQTIAPAAPAETAAISAKSAEPAIPSRDFLVAALWENHGLDFYDPKTHHVVRDPENVGPRA